MLRASRSTSIPCRASSAFPHLADQLDPGAARANLAQHHGLFAVGVQEAHRLRKDLWKKSMQLFIWMQSTIMCEVKAEL